LETLLPAFGVNVAFRFVAFRAFAVTFVVLGDLGVTMIGWAVAFAINSWASVTSSTACVVAFACVRATTFVIGPEWRR
jgi:hypothetical protein